MIMLMQSVAWCHTNNNKPLKQKKTNQSRLFEAFIRNIHSGIAFIKNSDTEMNSYSQNQLIFNGKVLPDFVDTNALIHYHIRPGRPWIFKRKFRSGVIDRVIGRLKMKMRDKDLAELFSNCWANSLGIYKYFQNFFHIEWHLLISFL